MALEFAGCERSLELSTTLPVHGRPGLHTVEVRHGGDPHYGIVRAGLYLDCHLQASAS